MDLPTRSDVHEAELTQGMEHMRFYVSVPSTHNPRPLPSHLSPMQGQQDGVTDANMPVNKESGPDTSLLPQSGISPAFGPDLNSPKRSDPFQFGTRYLKEGDDIFEFNAWDHVEVDDAFKAFAEAQFTEQRTHPASEYHRNVISSNPERPWNRFYSNNAGNFFKDRKWLFQEFPTLRHMTDVSARGSSAVLEIGAGAGNTAFPLLAANKNPKLKIHAVDYSTAAVEVMRKNPAYDERYIHANVWDLTAADDEGKCLLPPNLTAGSIDVAIMVFVLSALEPNQWQQALKNVWEALRPGGEVLFRDYGRGDLAQVRFKKGRWIADNFYVRGDGTRVYFFDEDELGKLWSGEFFSTSVQDSRQNSQETKIPGDVGAPYSSDRCGDFEILDLGTDRRMLVNRQRRLKMYRCWMQGRFRKPLATQRENGRDYQISTSQGEAQIGEEIAQRQHSLCSN
ncbi:MAG: hypothetical protein Q9162_006850 [Coniocarpon cinnabarinum]